MTSRRRRWIRRTRAAWRCWCIGGRRWWQSQQLAVKFQLVVELQRIGRARFAIPRWWQNISSADLCRQTIQHEAASRHRASDSASAYQRALHACVSRHAARSPILTHNNTKIHFTNHF